LFNPFNKTRVNQKILAKKTLDSVTFALTL
jgi:hypothetical protein